MCDPSAIAETAPHDELALIVKAAHATEAILERYLGLAVRKAMDLESSDGFDRAVARLAAELRAGASDSEQAAIRAAVTALDIDWRKATATARRRLIQRALSDAKRRTADVPGALDVAFGKAADAVVHASRDGARRMQRLRIGAELNATDHRIIVHMRSSQTYYVRDEYGRRHDAFGKRARRIVAEGLEAGLGRSEIAGALATAAEGTIGGKSSFYWEIVAGAFVGRGRSLAQLSAYAEASLQRYRIVAVLDEVTTPVCWLLDGKVFSVERGLDLFAQAEAAPERLASINPWIRHRRDPSTGELQMYVERGGARTRIGHILHAESLRGAGSNGLIDGEKLMGLGIGPPPFHALCRTVTVGV